MALTGWDTEASRMPERVRDMPTDFRLFKRRASPAAALKRSASAAPHLVGAWTPAGTSSNVQASFRDMRSRGQWISAPDVDERSLREESAPARPAELQPSKSATIAPFAAPSSEAGAGAAASLKWAAHARASGQTSVPHAGSRPTTTAALGPGACHSVDGAGLNGAAGVTSASKGRCSEATGTARGSAWAGGPGAESAAAVGASSGNGCACGGSGVAGHTRQRPATASSTLLRPSASVGTLPTRHWSAHGTRPALQTPSLASGRHSHPDSRRSDSPTRGRRAASPPRGRRADSPTRSQLSIWAAVAATSSPGEADEIVAHVEAVAATELSAMSMAGPPHLRLHRSASRRARSIAAAQAVAQVAMGNLPARRESVGMGGLSEPEQQLLSSLRRIPLLEQVLVDVPLAEDAQQGPRGTEGEAGEATETGDSEIAPAGTAEEVEGAAADAEKDSQTLPVSRPEAPLASVGRVAALCELMQISFVDESVCSLHTLAAAVQQRAEARILACVPGAAAVRVWSAEAVGTEGFPWTMLRSHLDSRVGIAAETKLGVGIVGSVALTHRSCLLTDSAADRRYSATVDGRFLEGVPSCTVPLCGSSTGGPSAQAELFGVLQLVGAQPGWTTNGNGQSGDSLSFSQDDVRTISAIARWLSGLLGLLSRAAGQASAQVTAPRSRHAHSLDARSDTVLVNSPGGRSTSPSLARKHRAPPALVSSAAHGRRGRVAADSDLPRWSLERVLEMLSSSLPSPFVPAAVGAATGGMQGGGAGGEGEGGEASGLLGRMGALIDPRGLLRVCEVFEATWEAAVWIICPQDKKHAGSTTRMRRSMCRIGTWRLIETEREQPSEGSADGRRRRNRGARGIDPAVAAALGRGERGMVAASDGGLVVPIHTLKVAARACSTKKLCHAILSAADARLLSDMLHEGGVDASTEQRVDVSTNGRLDAFTHVHMDASTNGHVHASTDGRMDASIDGRMDASTFSLDGPLGFLPTDFDAPLGWETGRGEVPVGGSEAGEPGVGMHSGGGGTCAGGGDGSGTRCTALGGGGVGGGGVASSGPREVLWLPVVGEDGEVAAMWQLTSVPGRQHPHRDVVVLRYLGAALQFHLERAGASRAAAKRARARTAWSHAIRRVIYLRAKERFQLRMKMGIVLQAAQKDVWRRGAVLSKVTPLLTRLTSREQLPLVAADVCALLSTALRSQRAMLTLLFPSLERGIVNLQIVAAPGVPPSVHSDADPFIFTSYDSLRGGVVVEGAPRLGLVSLAVRTNQVVVESHAYKSHQFNPLLDHACEWQHTPLESRSMLAVPLPARGRPDAALGAIVLVNKLRPGAAGRGPPHGSSSGHDELLEEGFGDNDAADLQAVATLVSLALESCDELLPWLRAIDAPAYVPAETGETSEAELGA